LARRIVYLSPNRQTHDDFGCRDLLKRLAIFAIMIDVYTQIRSELGLMATMNVSLPDAMKDWVDAQTSGERYANASDYVRALIRRDQERQDAIATLQAAIDEGLRSGPGAPFDPTDFKRQMRERHRAG
jgi:antitoxin ParD1/3/4